MTQQINMADIVVHLHQQTSGADKDRVEQGLRALNGVISVHFNSVDHPLAVVVAYDPQAVSSQTLLAEIRTSDPQAMMAGL